jgi:REP element-mobilizing transposase RayT
MKKTNQPQENMNTMQLEKKTRSNAQIDDLYRKIENNENQWFALDYILDHLNENQKVKIRRYIKDLIKEEKTTPKLSW